MSPDLLAGSAAVFVGEAEVEVCVHRYEPPLLVAGLVLDSPSVVRLRLQADSATGHAYAWTLNESEARLLESAVASQLEGLKGGSVILSAIVRALDGVLPPGVQRQRARTLVEGSLLDARLRSSNQSLASALGVEPRPMKVYASDLYDSQDLEVVRGLACQYVSEGFPGVKMRLGRTDIGWAKERLAAVREAVGPDTDLMVDAVQGWDLDFCHGIMPSLVAARLRWLEDPFRFGDTRSLADLCAWSPVPICTGESATDVGEIEAVIAAGAHLVMLDVQHLGGIGRTVEAMELVAAAGRELTFHVFPDLAVTLGAAYDIEWAEWAPLWGDCIPRPPLVGGRIQAGVDAGLGLWEAE